MKNRDIASTLALVALLPLTSCIAVEDYGTSWDQAVADRSIVGSWKQIQGTVDQTRAHGYGIGDITTFVEQGNAFKMSLSDESGKPLDRPEGPIKTLTLGAHKVLAFPAPQGMLERYEVHGSTMQICMGIGPSQVDWLLQHYPNAKSVGKNHDEGEYLVIHVLDKEASEIIASIPESEEYWDCSWKFVRVPNPAR